MKRKEKYYTCIIASNKGVGVKNLQFSSRRLKILMSVLGISFFAFLLLLFDYLSMSSKYIKNHYLTKQNENILRDYNQITKHFNELKEEVHQLKEFSNKIQMITSVQATNPHLSKNYGKLSSQIHLMSLPSPIKRTGNNLSQNYNEKNSIKTNNRDEDLNYKKHDEFIVEIKELKNKSESLKSTVWTHYTYFLDKKRFIDHTPSIMPVNGWISSRFGYRNESIYVDHEPYFHKGLDIAAKEGIPIVATASGQITYTGYDEDGFGKLIVINHGYNVKTYYAHLSEINVKIGDVIGKGSRIGEVGNTGNSKGPHLHYEVRILGIPINPINYILDTNDKPINYLTI